MLKNNNPGLFIAFEGIDGAGSSTQLNLLYGWLVKQNVSVLATKEPTTNVIGGLIRRVLTGDLVIPSDSLQLLYSADRSYHLAFEIVPVLVKGKIVLTDRYFFSAIAFGGLDLDKNWLLELNKNFLMPDIIFLLNVRAEVSMNRIKKSRNKTELFEKEEKLRGVAKNYLDLAKQFSSVIHVLDGEQQPEEIALQIQNIISQNSKFTKQGKS